MAGHCCGWMFSRIAAGCILSPVSKARPGAPIIFCWISRAGSTAFFPGLKGETGGTHFLLRMVRPMSFEAPAEQS